MSKKAYKILSEEGALRYAGEIGDEIEVDLAESELAVVAAGWLEPVLHEPAKTKRKEG